MCADCAASQASIFIIGRINSDCYSYYKRPKKLNLFSRVWIGCVYSVYPTFIYLSIHQNIQMPTAFLKSILILEIAPKLFLEQTGSKLLQKLLDILVFLFIPFCGGR